MAKARHKRKKMASFKAQALTALTSQIPGRHELALTQYDRKLARLTRVPSHTNINNTRIRKARKRIATAIRSLFRIVGRIKRDFEPKSG